MRLIAILGILSLVLVLIGCTAEQTAPEPQAMGGEPVEDPIVDEIQSDLDTASLDDIESDLDSLILE